MIPESKFLLRHTPPSLACVAAGLRTRLNHLYSPYALYGRFRAAATQATLTPIAPPPPENEATNTVKFHYVRTTFRSNMGKFLAFFGRVITVLALMYIKGEFSFLL